MRRVGHEVSEARDATEALNAVSEQPVDLVLVDLRMPGLNGIELVRQIRDINPDLPGRIADMALLYGRAGPA